MTKGSKKGGAADPSVQMRHTKAGPIKEQAGSGTPRIVWTHSLQRRFLKTMSLLGPNAKPNDILRIMNVEGLRRSSVASHLQKHRQNHRKNNQRVVVSAGGHLVTVDDWVWIDAKPVLKPEPFPSVRIEDLLKPDAEGDGDDSDLGPDGKTNQRRGVEREEAERRRGKGGADFVPPGVTGGLPGMSSFSSGQGAQGGFPPPHAFFDHFTGPGGHPGAFPPPGHQMGVQGVQSVLSYTGPPGATAPRLPGMMIEGGGAAPGIVGLPAGPNPLMSFPNPGHGLGGSHPSGPPAPQQ